jgi:hypothetical protein
MYFPVLTNFDNHSPDFQHLIIDESILFSDMPCNFHTRLTREPKHPEVTSPVDPTLDDHKKTPLTQEFPVVLLLLSFYHTMQPEVKELNEARFPSFRNR